MFEFIETKRHTLESIYGRPEADVLRDVDVMGYEPLRIGVPQEGDVALVGKVTPLAKVAAAPTNFVRPRLILRRKTVKRRVLTETGEVRKALRGEWYHPGDGPRRRLEPTPTVGAYPIYRETFVEVEA